MDQTTRDTCSACGASLPPSARADHTSTTVREHDKEFTLRHCPRCGTLLVRVRRTAVHAR